MAMHEVFGILAAAITGVVFVSALSPNASTSKVISASFSGAANLLNAISAPVRSGGGAV